MDSQRVQLLDEEVDAETASQSPSRTRIYQLDPYVSDELRLDAPRFAKEPKDIRQPLLLRKLQSKEKDKEKDSDEDFGLKKEDRPQKGKKKKKEDTPTSSPTNVPTISPTPLPSTDPTLEPTFAPTVEPSNEPTSDPTRDPTATPTVKPSLQPTSVPSNDPTLNPTASPTFQPTSFPTRKPRRKTSRPTSAPTATSQPTPVMHMTDAPTITPTTISPTTHPSESPSRSPSDAPSVSPSFTPSRHPSDQPSLQPSLAPTLVPSQSPSVVPSAIPSVSPSQHPSTEPSAVPSLSPSFQPSQVPSSKPSTAALITVQYSIGKTNVAGENRRLLQGKSLSEPPIHNLKVAQRSLEAVSADAIFRDAVSRSTREVIELKTSYIVMRDAEMTRRQQSQQVNVFESQYLGKSELSSGVAHQTLVKTEVEKVVVLQMVDEAVSLVPATLNSTSDGTSDRLVVAWWYASIQYGVFVRTSKTRRESGTGTSVGPDGTTASETTNVTVSYEGFGQANYEEVDERVQTAVSDAIADGTLLQLMRLSDESAVAVAIAGNEHLAQPVPIDQIVSQDFARYSEPLEAGSLDTVRIFGIGLFFITVTMAFLLYRAAKHRQNMRAKQEMWGSRLGPEKEVNEFLSIGLVMEIDARTATDASTLIKSDQRRRAGSTPTSASAGAAGSPNERRPAVSTPKTASPGAADSPDFSDSADIGKFVPKLLKREEMGYSDADSLLRGGFEKTTEMVRMPSDEM